jgi:hypothetical protein
LKENYQTVLPQKKDLKPKKKTSAANIAIRAIEREILKVNSKIELQD